MKIRNSSKAIPIYNGKILMILRDNIPTIDFANMWEPPGGGFKEGESKEEALLREFEEELSIVPSDYEFVEEYAYDNVETGKPWAINTFLVKLTDDEVKKLKLKEEGQEFRFFAIEELDDFVLTPLAKAMVEIYEKTLGKK